MAELGIQTEIRRSEEFPDSQDPSQRLATIVAKCGATEYWSGPAAKSYLDPEPFCAAGISVNFFDLDRIRLPGHPDPRERDRALSIVHCIATIGLKESKVLVQYAR